MVVGSQSSWWYEMKKKIVIVDYEMGNLRSISNALNFLDHNVEITDQPKTVENSDFIILPGVGSFNRAMNRLNETGLASAIQKAVICKQKKILGICLGFQLMGEYGVEDGKINGLGLIKGGTERFQDSIGIKIPQIGFNSVSFNKQSKLFHGLRNQSDFYFVNSYRYSMINRPGLQATSFYGGEYLAAYEDENVFGTQFHPEKSQGNGLKLIKNFLKDC